MIQEVCPECSSRQHLKPKLLLIAKYSPEAIFSRDNKEGFIRRDQLAVDECKAEILKKSPLCIDRRRSAMVSVLICD